MRTVQAGGAAIDAGPTVFTMRWVFEAIFADAGTSLDAHLTLRPAVILARHAWSAAERLDLFADTDRTADAIGAFAGPAEARGYRAFCARARAIYETLRDPVHPRGATDGAFARASPTGLSATDAHRAVRDDVAARSATTSGTRGCGSCSAATRPIAAPRRSRRPRR